MSVTPDRGTDDRANDDEDVAASPVRPYRVSAENAPSSSDSSSARSMWTT